MKIVEIIALTIGLFLISSLGFSQEEVNPFGFKAYTGLQFNYQNRSPKTKYLSISNGLRDDFTIQLEGISPALVKYSEKGNFFEVELTSFFVGYSSWLEYLEFNNNVKVFAGEKGFKSDFGVKFSQNIIFGKDDDKMQLFLGFTGNPSSGYVRTLPKTSRSFRTSLFYFQTYWGITPRLIVKKGKHLFYDFSVEYLPLRTAIFSSKTENPTIVKRHQRSTVYKVDFFPKQFQLRFGIGYRL